MRKEILIKGTAQTSSSYTARPMFNVTKGLIYQRVMAKVEERIKIGQQQYEERCQEIDREAFQKKVDASDEIVSGILGE